MIWPFGKETKRQIEEVSGAIKKLVEEISERHDKCSRVNGRYRGKDEDVDPTKPRHPEAP